MFLLLFLNSLFALTYIIMEFILNFTTPLVLLTFRMLFAGVFLLSFQYIKNRKLLIIKKNDFIYILITCLLHMFINFLSEAYALQKISSIMVSMFYLLSPIFSAIIDYIFNKNILNKKQIIIVLTGTLLSLCMIFLNTNEVCSFNKSIYPYILLLISILTSTLALYRIKQLLKKGYSLVTINGYATMLSGIIFLYMTYYTNTSLPSINIYNIEYIFFPLFLLALIGNVIGYNLYDQLLIRYNITTILFAELLSPCFIAYYQWFFFNITPKINHFIFFILFATCIIAFNYYEKKKYK